MKHIKPILWILVLFCLVGVVYGAAGDAIIYHNFDNNTVGNAPESMWLGASGTASACTTDYFNVSQEGSDKYIKWLFGTCHYVLDTTVTSGTYCLELELNQTFVGNGVNDNPINFGDQSATLGFTVYGQGYGQDFHYYDSGEGTFTGSTPGAGWHNITFCIDLDVDVGHLWIDTVRQTDSDWQARTANEDFDNILFDNPELDNNSIRQICGWLGNYSDRPATCDNAGGGAASGQTINMSTDVKPTTLSQYNQDTINFNITGINASYNFNCSLVLNGTVNQTTYDYTNGSDLNVNFTTTLADGDWKFYINCSDNETEQNTTNNTFYIDTNIPEISVSSGLTSNNSVVYTNGVLLGQINLTDANLYALNITTNGSIRPIIIYNTTNLSGKSPYMYNLSFDPLAAGLTPGAYLLEIEASDSHTAELIPEYDYIKNSLTKSLTYRFGGDSIIINPTNDGLFTTIDTEKLTDRYTFTYDRDWSARLLYGNDMKFEVTSTQKIDIIEDSSYKGHLVVPGLKKWIDFNNNDKNAVVTTKRINDYKVEISITGATADPIIFNSIGGLNVIRRNYTFYYGNFTESSINRTLETDQLTYTLNFTVNSSYVDDINATLLWNGTSYTPIETSGTNWILFTRTITLPFLADDVANVNPVLNWTYNVSTTDTYILNNKTNNSNTTIYQMNVTNSSADLRALALNITLLSEYDSTAVTSDTEALFHLYNRTSSLQRDYSMSYTQGSEVHFYMYPNISDINSNFEMIFTATDYVDRHYSRTGITLNSTQQNITILMTPSSNATDITVTLVDENDEKLIGYSIEAWRYTLSTGEYTLIDSQLSNNDGKALFQLDVSTNEYKFVVKNINGVTVFTRPKEKLIDTSYTFRITLESFPDTGPNVIAISGLDYTLDVDRNTRKFTLTWNDVASIIDSINMTVLNSTANSTEVISTQTSTLDASTLTYTVDSSMSAVVKANVYVVATLDGETYYLDTISIDLREEWDTFGTEALIMSFLFVGTMIFIGVAVSAEACIILSLVGMVAFVVLGFLHVAPTGLVSLVVGGIILLVRLYRR